MTRTRCRSNETARSMRAVLLWAAQADRATRRACSAATPLPMELNADAATAMQPRDDTPHAGSRQRPTPLQAPRTLSPYRPLPASRS
ncbi:hypothetical protein WI92_23735 [Burkholderia vietnamiensis]|nr:hypothetical protein WL96_09430 [Burkholderia vietnamiensis]KVE21835.1 hypothetical protein WI92_23735 [Burkholderia vietnamiensis]